MLKASKNISDFYACFDLMEITTLGNLVAIAIETSGFTLEGNDAHLSEEAFTGLVKDIFDKISVLGKWDRMDEDDSDDETEDEDEESDNEEEEGSGPREEGNAGIDGDNDEDEVLSFYYGRLHSNDLKISRLLNNFPKNSLGKI